MKAKKIIAANWKMNGNAESIKKLTQSYVQNFEDKNNCNCIICPPFPYLTIVENIIKNSAIKLGAQNVSEHLEGAYTGEISCSMLHDLGAKYVIIGHSERKKYFHETLESIAKKVEISSENGLIPILCVGEELLSRKEGNHLSEIKKQIQSSQIANLPSAIIAYEPVWSIGTGVTPTCNEIQEVVEFIKGIVDNPVLYGGSVNGNNISEFSPIANLDGFLIGNASLNSEEVKKISLQRIFS